MSTHTHSRGLQHPSEEACSTTWGLRGARSAPGSTDLFSELDVDVLGEDAGCAFDMRDTNFWMVLRDGALIRELRRLWYFWNRLSTWCRGEAGDGGSAGHA